MTRLKRRLERLEQAVEARLFREAVAFELQCEVAELLNDFKNDVTPKSYSELCSCIHAGLPKRLEAILGESWEAHWWLRP
jgi:hypothetical protein